MPTVEERIAFLEGRVEEHARNVDGVREALASLEVRMDRRFEGIDRRFETIDRRFDAVDARFTVLEDKLDRRFEAVDAAIGRLTGIVVSAVVAILAVAGGILVAVR